MHTPVLCKHYGEQLLPKQAHERMALGAVNKFVTDYWMCACARIFFFDRTENQTDHAARHLVMICHHHCCWLTRLICLLSLELICDALMMATATPTWVDLTPEQHNGQRYVNVRRAVPNTEFRSRALSVLMLHVCNLIRHTSSNIVTLSGRCPSNTQQKKQFTWITEMLGCVCSLHTDACCNFAFTTLAETQYTDGRTPGTKYIDNTNQFITPLMRAVPRKTCWNWPTKL